MPGALFLEGDKINLRTIEEEDLEFLRENINDPETRKFLTSNTPKNLEQEREFFEDVISSDESVNLAIARDEEMIGMVTLREKDNGLRTGEIGIWIAPEHHGNGYGTESVELITGYGFNELNYHRIMALAYESNKASQRIWEKLGFEKEGELREHVYRNGDFENAYLYGVLEHEWKQ